MLRKCGLERAADSQTGQTAEASAPAEAEAAAAEADAGKVAASAYQQKLTWSLSEMLSFVPKEEAAAAARLARVACEADKESHKFTPFSVAKGSFSTAYVKRFLNFIQFELYDRALHEDVLKGSYNKVNVEVAPVTKDAPRVCCAHAETCR